MSFANSSWSSPIFRGHYFRSLVPFCSVTLGSLVLIYLLILPPRESQAQSAKPIKAVRVTDIKGNVSELIRSGRSIITDIDYYDGPYVNKSDLELDAIRMRQGEGTISVGWSRIDRIQIEKEMGDGLEARLWLTNTPDAPKTVILVKPPKKGLHGYTDLGEFSIHLPKIKSIEVIR